MSEIVLPDRVQLRRTRGWRKPEGVVNVARPTRWGNPFKHRDRSTGLVRTAPAHLERFGREWDFEGRISGPGNRHDMWFTPDDIVETYVRWATFDELVELYRLTLVDPTPGMLLAAPSTKGRLAKVTVDEIRSELAGKRLACWCPPDRPCHADVLLQLANPDR